MEIFMENTTQTQQPQAGRVTLDEIRALLVEHNINPNDTNASKVRELLGNRGSFDTIQKALTVIRAEVAAASVPVANDQVPALPSETAQAMWLAAWSAAQVQTLKRSETLASERDAALLRLETMTADVNQLVATVDDHSAKLDQAAVTVATVQAAHLADVERMKAERDAAASSTAAERIAATLEIERLRQELVLEKAQAKHAAEIAEAGRDLLRQELARLTDQVGELKAALYKRVEAPKEASKSTLKASETPNTHP